MTSASLRLGTLLAALAFASLPCASAQAADGPCGYSPTDWCPAPPGDPCGRHRTEAECRADLRCSGMPYRGESVVACIPAGRGFSSNCPAVGCTSAPAQPASPRKADPAAPFRAAWQGLSGARDGRWDLHVSAGFPRSWPPGAEPAVVRYAFAMRHARDLSDGMEVAAPWARSTESADGTVTMELLRPQVDRIGIQGVRPMRADELSLARREEEVAVLLTRPLDPAGESLVRRFTCDWLKRQGTAAAEILPRHEGFVRWLACLQHPGSG